MVAPAPRRRLDPAVVRLVLFLGAAVLLVSLATCVFRPRLMETHVKEYMDLKQEGRIEWVKIRKDVLTAGFRGDIQRDGKSYSRLRVIIPATYMEFRGAYEKLYKGLPPDKVDRD